MTRHSQAAPEGGDWNMITDDCSIGGKVAREAEALIAAHNGRFGNPDHGIKLEIVAVTGEVSQFNLCIEYLTVRRTCPLGFDVKAVEAALSGIDKAVAEIVHEGAVHLGGFGIFPPLRAEGQTAYRVEHRDDAGTKTGSGEFATVWEAMAYVAAGERAGELLCA